MSGKKRWTGNAACAMCGQECLREIVNGAGYCMDYRVIFFEGVRTVRRSLMANALCMMGHQLKQLREELKREEEDEKKRGQGPR